MNINDRLRHLRKNILKLNQSAFGKEYLGLSSSGVSEIEAGRRNVTDQHIIALKNKNISEKWLRTGEGEVFSQFASKEEELLSWAEDVFRDENNTFKQRFVKMLMTLDDASWDVLAGMAQKILNESEYKNTSNGEISTSLEPNIDIEEELQAYRLELEATTKGKTSSASAISKDTNTGTNN